MTYMSSDKWPRNSIIFINLKKELKNFCYCILKEYPHFHNHISKTSNIFCKQMSAANAMTSPNKIASVEYSCLDGVKCSEFQNNNIVTLEQKSDGEEFTSFSLQSYQKR